MSNQQYPSPKKITNGHFHYASMEIKFPFWLSEAKSYDSTITQTGRKCLVMRVLWLTHIYLWYKGLLSHTRAQIGLLTVIIARTMIQISEQISECETESGGHGAARCKETLQTKSCSQVIFFVFLRFTTLCWFRPFNVTRCKQMLLYVCYRNCVPALSQCECRIRQVKLNSIISLNLNRQLLPLISLSGFHTFSDTSNSRRRKKVDSFYQTLTIKKGSVLNLTIKKRCISSIQFH